MSFSSIVFIFLFIPFFLLLYYLLNPKLRTIYLIIASFIFYLWAGPGFLLLLLISTIVNYLFGLGISAAKGKYKKGLLVVFLLANILFLIFYKYSNFIVDQLNIFLPFIHQIPVSWQKVIMPLAISFYTFQQISYGVDIYKGEKLARNILNYMLFVTFFPKLIAGPLVRINDFQTQIEARKESIKLVFDGMYRFALGLFEKVFIADILGQYVNQSYNPEITTLPFLTVWFIVLSYTFQIFFDFSGYTNMAIGIGQMVGFTLPENFNRPYFSKNITEFWRRWHITLGKFLKDYLYIPLGGNRVSKLRNIFNYVVVFAIGGIWHGVGFNFLIWGIYFGILLGLEKHLFKNLLVKLPQIVQTGITFLLVIISWIFFRSPSLISALKILKAMFLPARFDFQLAVFDYRLFFVFALALLVTFIPFPQTGKIAQFFQNSTVIRGALMLVFLILALLTMSSGTLNAFIYEQF